MKDIKTEERLRELLNKDPDLKAAFKETIEEMQRKIKELKEEGNHGKRVKAE